MEHMCRIRASRSFYRYRKKNFKKIVGASETKLQSERLIPDKWILIPDKLVLSPNPKNPHDKVDCMLSYGRFFGFKLASKLASLEVKQAGPELESTFPELSSWADYFLRLPSSSQDLLLWFHLPKL